MLISLHTYYSEILMDTFKNQYKVETKQLVSLSVYNVGFQRCEPLHQWGPGVRDHYLIHYIVSGYGFYTFGSETVRLGAGDAFVIYPDTGVTYRADENEPWEYYWVGFSGSDAPSLLAATQFTRSLPVIRKDQTSCGDLLKEHILRIYNARGNNYSSAARMAGELYLTLSVLMDSAAKGRQPDDYSYVQRAIDHMAMNYSYPISIDSVADHVGISRSQLFREFKRYTGTSPKEYLTGLRIRKSAQLLKSTSLTVTEVANSVGYDNSLYFSKVFSKEMGEPPTTWRTHQE